MQGLALSAAICSLNGIDSERVVATKARQLTSAHRLALAQVFPKNPECKRVHGSTTCRRVALQSSETVVAQHIPQRVARQRLDSLEDILVADTERQRQA